MAQRCQYRDAPVGPIKHEPVHLVIDEHFELVMLE